MSDKNLRRRLIVAAYERPEIRGKILPHLNPVMDEIAFDKTASETALPTTKEEMREALTKVAAERPDLREKINAALFKSAADSVPYGETDRLLENLRGNAVEFTQYMRNLRDTANALGDLVKIAEKGRFDRSEDVVVSNIKFNGQEILASTKSEKGGTTYNTRISLLPRRGYNCTCPDRERRGGSVGPCKHVLALGRAFWNEELQPELENIEKAFGGVMSQMKLLPK